MTKDEEHLRLLAIFHYVVAGLTAFFSLFPLMHVFMGVLIASGNFAGPDDFEMFPRAFGWFFIIMGGMFITFGLALALTIALGGRSIQRRQNRVFCLVVAGLSCLIMPFGTVLGVFTIVTLMRDSVKELFEPAASPSPEA